MPHSKTTLVFPEVEKEPQPSSSNNLSPRPTRTGLQAPLSCCINFTAASVHHLLLYASLLLLLLTVTGCTVLNRYILVPKQELVFTPAKYRIPYEEVWFPAQDGVQLNGWLLPGLPDQPLLLLFHGNAGNLSDNVEYLNLLHGSGFPLFIFDYRGFGKSKGDALREKDLYLDARGAVAYLELHGWTPDRMIFFGQSMGAAVALQMALEKKPAGLVMESPFTSIKDMFKHTSPFTYYTVGWWSFNLPFDNMEKIAQAQMPLLLIHGDRDAVVPVTMSQRLYAKAGGNKILHIVPGGGHCNAYEVAPDAYLAAWRSYLTSIDAAEKPVSTGSPHR